MQAHRMLDTPVEEPIEDVMRHAAETAIGIENPRKAS
jgi:hypothetical protein